MGEDDLIVDTELDCEVSVGRKGEIDAATTVESAGGWVGGTMLGVAVGVSFGSAVGTRQAGQPITFTSKGVPF
jgi:hypothetical protein